jgi:hypothetical protein
LDILRFGTAPIAIILFTQFNSRGECDDSLCYPYRALRVIFNFRHRTKKEAALKPQLINYSGGLIGVKKD